MKMAILFTAMHAEAQLFWQLNSFKKLLQLLN
jgi:hypothetical protein